MIVRNEENYLADCLESVKDIADEIVVVDTGSTDDTLKIAELYKARIYSFKWIDDFSAARNFALSKSNGRWVFYLDADERLSPGSVQIIKEIISRDEKAGVSCKVVSRNSDNCTSQNMFYTRMFYNDPALKFTGAIHEQIDPSLVANAYSLYHSEIQIDHIGYDIPWQQLSEKAERNLWYLLKEYEKNPTSYIAYQIGNTYSILNDVQNSLKYFSLALLDEKLHAEYKAFCFLHLGSAQLANHEISEAAMSILSGIKENPALPQFYLMSSQINFRSGRIKDALNDCKKAYEVNEQIAAGTNKYFYITTSINPRKILYQGIYIAFGGNKSIFLNDFLGLLSKLDSDEGELISKLISKQMMSMQEVSLLAELTDENNIQCITTLLDSYPFTDIVINITEFLLRSFPDNSRLLVLIGKKMYELKHYPEAIRHFKRAMDAHDPSAAFLLISVLIEMNNLIEIPIILSRLENEFHNVPEIIERAQIMKNKITPFLIT